MPSNPNNFQGIVPITVNQVAERIGLTTILLGPLLDYQAQPIALDPATVFHLWIAAALPSLPVPVNIIQYTPFLPLLWSPNNQAPYFNTVHWRLCIDDFNVIPVYNSSFTFELLASKDGGQTVDKCAKGTITVPSFLTDNF